VVVGCATASSTPSLEVHRESGALLGTYQIHHAERPRSTRRPT
jgi:hypothetical protein